MSIMDKTMEGLVGNLPEAEAKKIEKVGILTRKAISLAQQGKSDEAKKVMDEIKNIK